MVRRVKRVPGRRERKLSRDIFIVQAGFKQASFYPDVEKVHGSTVIEK